MTAGPRLKPTMKTFFHPPIKEVRLENVLYALSDPVRLSVVQQLDSQGEMTCGEFSCAEPKGKSTMTHHFRVLRESGLIHTQVDGREHLTTLRRKELDAKFPGLLGSILSAAESARPLAKSRR
ncbi:MAG TPA: helix-turn-helix transcriptional regulator [Drouetiella sp.]|jgi:DNA-binding transcriptional ArsR family regulator